jgi:Flp pilus assembly pilin Flp
VIDSDGRVSMRSELTRVIREDAGQDLIEYAFLGVFLVLVILGGISMIGNVLNNGYSNLGTSVSNAS